MPFGLHWHVIPCKPSQYYICSFLCTRMAVLMFYPIPPSCHVFLELKPCSVDFNTGHSHLCCSDRKTDWNSHGKLLNKFIVAFFLSFRGKFSDSSDFLPPIIVFFLFCALILLQFLVFFLFKELNCYRNPPDIHCSEQQHR